MQMRLAFSVATAIRPNILIIDEALAVGDTYFQHKSFDRIKKFREEGTNLLIVSHDRASIQALCDRAILLEKGRILKDGNPEEVMDYYNAIIAEKESGTINTSKSVNGKIQTISGTKQATVANIYMTDCDGQLKEVLRVGDYAYLIVEIDIHDDLPALVLGYMIKDRLGQIMYGTNTWHTGQVVGAPRRGDRLKFRIKFQIVFGAGSYSIATALVSTDTHMSDNYEWKELALVFNVVNESKTYFIGSTWNEPVIDLEKI
jgi:lipopolysaccharide transport system ATP-binding protein